MAARTKRAEVPAPDVASTSSALDELTGALPRLVEISIDSLYPHPQNPRRDLGDLSELAASIKAVGIRQPLTAVPEPGVPGAFRTVIGHRRRAAAVEAGLTVVPCIVDESLTPARQLELMLVENVQRSDLTAVEEADGYQGLLDLGLDVEAIAGKTGRSVSTVRRRLQLVALPADTRERVHFHQGSLGDAELLADTLARPDIVARPQLAAALTEAYGSRRNFAAFVADQVADVELEEAQAKLAAELTEKGTRVVPRPPSGDKKTRPLYDLTAVDEQYGPAIPEKKHTKCPGRVVWLSWRYKQGGTARDREPVIVEGCNNWKDHGHFDRQAPRRVSKKDASNARRVTIANNKAAAAARAPRLEWIRTVLLTRHSMPVGSTVFVAALLTVGRGPDYRETSVHREILGGDDDTVIALPSIDTDADALWHLVVHALAVAEARMFDKSWWSTTYQRDVIARHLRYLAANGYALAAIERTFLGNEVDDEELDGDGEPD